MNKYFLMIFLAFLCVISFAQNKKKQALPNKAVFTSSVILRTAQLDSTFTETIYEGGKFISYNNDGKISCSDSTLKFSWKQQLSGNISVRPVVIDSILVVGTDNSEINTFDLATGAQLQSIGLEERITTALFAFEYVGKKELMIPKQTDSKAAIVFGMVNGKISCLDLESLQEYWQNSDQKDSLFTKPILLNNKLVFTRGDGSLNCIDANTGLLIWRWLESESANFSRSEIVSDGKSIYLVSADSMLYSINFLLGRLNWRLEKEKISPNFFYSSAQKNIFLIHQDKKLIIFSVLGENEIDSFTLKHNPTYNSYHFFEFNKNVFFVYDGVIYEAIEKELLREIFKLDFATVKSFYQLDTNKFAALSSDSKLVIFIMR
ncbi:MAG: PQQ-binding-like beta-propeller repeat protein [Melioribacteraceae bacterium]